MNYKRQKPKLPDKNKHKKETPVSEDNWRSVPAKYPLWYCKKRKGKHEFILKKEEKFWILPGIWQTFICSSCGKKRIVHTKKED